MMKKSEKLAYAIADYKKSDQDAVRRLIENKSLSRDEKLFILGVGLLDFNADDETVDEMLVKINEQSVLRESFKNTKALLETLQSSIVDDNKIISFGFNELDYITGGIFPTSLVVVGARTGHGKSKFCGELALRTAKQGLSVVYFDLENDEGDFINRETVTRLAERGIFIQKSDLKKSSFWEKKEAETAYEIYEEIEKETGNNLKVFSGEKIPTLEQFLKYMDALDGAALVIIDHLHYFSLDDAKMEHQQISQIMRRIRTFTKTGTPVVIASHVRAPQGKEREPSNGDLFGSSNIAKEAETVLFPYILPEQEGEFNTKLIIAKNRTNGNLKSLFAKFDHKKNKITEVAEDAFSSGGGASHDSF